MKLKSFLLILIIGLMSSCKWGSHKQFQGYIEGENIYLASPFSGILKELLVVRGQHVHKGDLIFKLDPNPQDITIVQIQGELEQAKSTLTDLQKPKREPEIAAIQAQIEQTNAQIQLAQIRVGRFQKLYTRQATDKDTLDSASANLQQQLQLKQQYESNLVLAKLGSRDDQITAQKAQITTLEAKLNQAKWDLAQKQVIAPDTGVIFDTYFRAGEYVGTQQPVASLLTPKNVHVEFYVPLEYASKLQIGQIITFECEGCDDSNTAIISYVSPDAEYLPPLVYTRENNSKIIFRVKANISDPLKFKPGLPVTVTL